MLLSKMKVQQRGFTLIELMFTIVVLAVLLSLALPSFRQFTMNSRMTSAANDLLGDLNLARSEAIKRRSQVTVCGSNGAATPSCNSSGTGFSAWVVFIDADGDNTLDAGEVILRQHEQVPTSITVTAAATTITGAATAAPFVSYQGSGFGTSGSTSQITFCDSRKNQVSVGGVPAARAVVVGPSGRSGVTRPSSGCS